MTAKNKADLTTDNDDDIKPGVIGGILAAVLNNRRKDFIDSMLNIIETAQQTLAGPIKFMGSLVVDAGFYKSMASFSANSSTTALGLKAIYRLTAITADTTLTISSAHIATGSAANPLSIIVEDASGNIVNSGFTLIIATEGAETIDGLSFVVITADYGVFGLHSDGSNLFSGMGGPNFNATTQQAKTRGPTEADIFGPAQLPLTLADDGNMRWHPVLGMRYATHGSFEIPLIALPESISATPQAVEISAANQNDALLFNGSDIPHIWGRSNGTFVIRGTTLSDTSNGGAGGGTVLFDIVGSSVATTLILDNAVATFFKSIGNAVDLQLDVDSSTCVSCAAGLTLRNSANSLGSSLIGFITLNPFGIITTSPFMCFMGEFATVGQSVGNIQQGSEGVAFCIDSAATGTFDIIGNSFDGVGEFFAPPLSKAIAGFEDAAVSIDSFRASTLPGNSATHTEAVFLTKTDLIIGQEFLISGNVDYDGLRLITGVSSDQFGVEFLVIHNTSTGGVSERTKVNAVGHFMVRDQTNTIAGAPNHNGTEKIQILVDVDNFIIPVAFVAVTGGGTVSATSKDEDSVDVTSRLNGEAPNSTIVAEANLLTNALITDIPAVGALVIINGTTWIGSDEVRLSVGSNGVTQYVGSTPKIRLKLDGNIILEPENSQKELSCQFGRCDAERTIVTFTNGTNLINETATPLINGNTITFNGNAGTLPAELREDIVYFIVGQVTNGFQVAYTSGGVAIAFNDDGSGTNTYALAAMRGAKPSNSIAANSPRTLVPQALVKMDPQDNIFTVVSNDEDATDILVSKAYYRNFI